MNDQPNETVIDFNEGRDALRTAYALAEAEYPTDFTLGVSCRALRDSIDQFELARQQAAVAEMRFSAGQYDAADLKTALDDLTFAKREVNRSIGRVREDMGEQ
jgi:hypothetical protein